MSDAFLDLWWAFVALLGQFGTLLAVVARALLPWLPGGLWCAWWLWCVDWKRAWPVLKKGGWVGVVLVVLASALAWSGAFPSAGPFAPKLPLPNFWWQLAACSALAVAALFCGWLQGRLGLRPFEVSFDPPAGHGDHHGHH